MLVGEYCHREVVAIPRQTGISEAARLMRQHHVGSLVIVDENDGRRQPVGIVTDRDLVIEVLAQDVPIEQLTLEDIMRSPLETAWEDDSVLDTLQRMRRLGVRRLPVIDARGSLSGILAVDDLLDLISTSLSDIVSLVANEIRTEEQQRP
ncbi:MAG TPA: CBS domain-containing protein [Pseudomonadales bacterium]|jgi:CBS domain-containing protein|nr:CBS domain-containing protein [Pseudomonadales bacterium]HMU91330.1 CBS domain-containing protein [Pseudomonadales bacterium]HMW16183.1 CBS domain-containing protein [Pseudomonadales bacterium]HMW84352.1 CBS domain-containing protein [Pseudomonadales bacterium]HMY97966.1 CBS domain-containing protein [Pseudomonadales bacterium]